VEQNPPSQDDGLSAGQEFLGRLQNWKIITDFRKSCHLNSFWEIWTQCVLCLFKHFYGKCYLLIFEIVRFRQLLINFHIRVYSNPGCANVPAWMSDYCNIGRIIERIWSFKIYFIHLRKTAKVTINVVMSLHLSVFPPVLPSARPHGHLGYHFMKFYEMFISLKFF